MKSFADIDIVRKISSFVFCILLLASGAHGQVRWGNEATDTLRINEILQLPGLRGADAATAAAMIAREFEGTPYGAGTLEADGDEILTVRLDSLDCTTFVETVAALALSASSGRTTWRDFVRNLRSIRYRSATVDGYPSRLHYISDWALDNTRRGNFSEVTNRFAAVDYTVKTLDFMSRHPQAYPALRNNPDNLARIRQVEEGYRSHRYPFIKKRFVISDRATLAAFRSGDIVAFTTDTQGLDVAHLGIILVEEGTPRLIHASSKGGKVMVDALPLSEYMRRSRSLSGVRVFRF